MILEEETFEKFGYFPKKLKIKSNKRILTKCDGCGIKREICKSDYRKLCRSCALKTRFKNPENHPMYGKYGEDNSNYGRHCTEETKQKIREANEGKHHSEKTKEKISESLLNKKFSKEHKQKLSEAKIGTFRSEEIKKKISVAQQNMTETTKQKMRDNHADFRGEKSGMWKGGLSFEPYCIKFNDEFKERAREYWNRRCVLCGKDEKENGNRLNVHHVTYNKDTCCDGSVPLFVVLCNSCHGKTSGNREYWENEFKQIVYSESIDGKCFYSKEEMKAIQKLGDKK